MKDNSLLTVVDIGNSKTEFALWDGKKLFNHKTFPTKTLTVNFLKKQKNIAASSVVPAVREKLKKEKILWIDTSLDTGVDFSLIDKKTIGSDRISTSAAVAKIAKTNSVIVDCGTAITVDALSANKVFMGGAIMPGPGLMMQSLHYGTGALPLTSLKVSKKQIFAGRNTVLAIRSGVGNGIRGAVKQIIEGLVKECEFHKYDIFLTGGGARFLLDILPGIVYLDDLVLMGIAVIWERNR